MCDSANAGTYTYFPNSVLKLGGTFDPENLHLAFAPCITYDREYPIHVLDRTHRTDKPTNVNAHNEISVEQIKTIERLYSFLNISASISAHFAFFGGDANMTFESENLFETDSFNFGMRGLARFGEVGLINPKLNEDSVKLVNNLPALYARCGREWVTQETRGVQIAVIYSIKNVSESQRSRLEAAILVGLIFR